MRVQAIGGRLGEARPGSAQQEISFPIDVGIRLTNPSLLTERYRNISLVPGFCVSALGLYQGLVRYDRVWTSTECASILVILYLRNAKHNRKCRGSS